MSSHDRPAGATRSAWETRGILLTGATGFIGGDLLGRLLARDPEATVYCLTRAQDAGQLEARRRALLAWVGIGEPDRDRVVAVAGDVVREDLGLGDAYERLAGQVDEIYHVAATTKFDLGLAEARSVNREGAKHVLAFARAARGAGGLRRLHHVSTAYVVGNREGVLAEDDVPPTPEFRNTYETTKWEGEQVLAPSRAGVPVTCYRPSIVVGDSQTGRTLHFRVLYEPMKWIYLGKIAILPCRPEVRLDVVPVDYVCDALLELGSRADSEGQTYHLTCGPEGAMSIGEMVDEAMAEVNRYHSEIGAPPLERPDIVSPDPLPSSSREERAKLEQLFALGEKVMGTHVPYMLTEQLFDSTRAREGLRDTGIECPPLRDYFSRIVRWAGERRFRVIAPAGPGRLPGSGPEPRRDELRHPTPSSPACAGGNPTPLLTELR
jgi:thioester reductase-like protein